MERRWYYTRNDKLLNSPLNKRFEDILWMRTEDFRQWCIDIRKLVVKLWDEEGLPPRVGFDRDEMVDQFNQMFTFPVHEFLVTDELTGEKNVIRNTSFVGNAVNQFFPTMMKTKISYSADTSKAKSIYDYFANDDLLESFITYATRHFKRDSFYHYSNPVQANDQKHADIFPCADTGKQWIKEFEERYYDREDIDFDYWLCPKDDVPEYTGYNEELKTRNNLYITQQEFLSLPQYMRDTNCTTNMRGDIDLYQIRVYKYGQRLFPVGLKAWRTSFAQAAVNFPPLTAKYLYERYTEEIKEQDRIVLYDPSAGWGGRIAGAMSVDDARCIHYVGTDPNTEHDTVDGRTKYHEVADFINNETYRTNSLFPKSHTYDIFQLGSEVIRNNKKFQKYKGKVDLVFTSPPYFNREVYSQEETQSSLKFRNYVLWRDGFLKPTLETCVEWLKENRYLLWNVADIKVGKEFFPIEEDSRKILESLGMVYIETLKMTLGSMPGGNRSNEDGTATAKNFVRVADATGKGKSLLLKYEPVLVFKKPYEISYKIKKVEINRPSGVLLPASRIVGM